MNTPLSVQAQRVIACCETHWQAHKSDCSGFVKAVANDLTIALSGNADDITDYLRGLPNQTTDGAAASSWSEHDKLVIACLKGSEHTPPRLHGHVVIVVPGELAHGKYPVAYWGTLGGEGKKRKPLNWAWNHNDRDRILFAAIPLS
jgi:hypothetical protein